MREKWEWIYQRHSYIEKAGTWSSSEVFCLLCWHSTHPSSCGRGKDLFGISKFCFVLFSERVFCMWEPSCWLIYRFEVKNERASTTNMMVFHSKAYLSFKFPKALMGSCITHAGLILTGSRYSIKNYTWPIWKVLRIFNITSRTLY